MISVVLTSGFTARTHVISVDPMGVSAGRREDIDLEH
jgi:hypothetical protein